jgi:hypothetical protein
LTHLIFCVCAYLKSLLTRPIIFVCGPFDLSLNIEGILVSDVGFIHISQVIFSHVTERLLFYKELMYCLTCLVDVPFFSLSVERTIDSRCMRLKMVRRHGFFLLLLFLSGQHASVNAWEVFFGECRFSDDSGWGTVSRALAPVPPWRSYISRGRLDLSNKGIKELPAGVFANMSAMT